MSASADSWDEGLLAEQRAVAATPRGDVVLLAGPGTGTTHVLCRRVQFLVNGGIEPNHITALTFSRAAAAEMRDRLEVQLGAAGKRVRVSTLHSYSLHQLLAHGARSLPAPLRVADNWEERWIVVQELAKILHRRVSEIQNGRDGALDRLADDWDTLTIDGAGWDEGYPDPRFLAVWRKHREVYGYALRSELVYQLLCELRSDPALVPSATEIFVVDEYQDLNRCDLSAIRMLAKRGDAEVFAAGDDDQSIYSFRHAAPGGIRGFLDDYPGASKLTLGECLRCGPDVVKISNWLIAQEQDREQKSLTSVTDWPASVHLLRFQNQETEAAAVARAIKAEVEAGTPAEEILVLVKSDPHGYIADAIERALELLSEHIYFPRGHRGPAEDEVQDVVAWLVLSISVAEGRVDDLALRTLLQLEDNGIGATRLARVRDLAMEHGLRFHEVLDHIHLGSLAAESLDPVVDAGRALIGKAEQISPRPDEDFNAWLVRVADDLSAGTEIFEYLVQISREITGEVAELEMTIEEEEQGQAKPLAPVDFLGELLTAMAGAPDSAPSHLPGRVTFTTMHGAKGLSADVVFLLQAEDQVIPGTAAGPDFDEARRLLYVSMTWARKRLVITACYRRVGPQRFVGSEEMVTRSLTRFLVDYGLVAETLAEYLLHVGERSP